MKHSTSHSPSEVIIADKKLKIAMLSMVKTILCATLTITSGLPGGLLTTTLLTMCIDSIFNRIYESIDPVVGSALKTKHEIATQTDFYEMATPIESIDVGLLLE